MEIDPKRIRILSKEKEEENWRFRSFLKGYDISIEELDAIVHELYEKVSSEIECTACANCCEQVTPLLYEEDIKRLARSTGDPVSQFKEKYLVEGEDEGNFEFNMRPCPFLKNKRCSQYDARPKDCRSFPHLHKPEFVFRLIGVVENCSICPIVFNVYEYLKDEIWHDDFSWGNGESGEVY
jgi:Fe-S-cluster containining protein